jgi:hypothetical protein
MLLEIGEIQLQLTAVMLAELEAISAHMIALHPEAATKSEELNDQFSATRDQALARAQEMIGNLRERLAELEIR